MTIVIKHNRVATAADDPEAEINKDEWNDVHVVTGILGTPITTTYADILAMATGGTLVPGQKYRFEFTHQNDLGDATIHNGTPEWLVVTAFTSSTLEKIAYSESYPNDIIEYSLIATSPYLGNYGAITYRTDTSIKNIAMPFDFRNQVFRWGQDGAGDYVIPIGESPGLYEDHPIFPAINSSYDIYVEPASYNLPWLSFRSAYNSTLNLGRRVDPIVFLDSVTHYRCGQCCRGLFKGQVSELVQGDGASVEVQNKNAGIGGVIGPGIQWTSQGNGLVFPNIGFNISGELKIGYSNFVTSMDWDWSNDMAAAAITSGGPADKDIRFAGVVTLLGANGTLSTSQLTNFNTNHPVTFIAEAGYTFTFAHTLYANINADGQILAQADIVINGNYGDKVMLEQVSITNGNGTFNVLKQVGVAY